MQMLIWGFMSQFLYEHSEWFVRAGGILIAAVLLWDVMFRSNIGVSISFLEEMWSRNLGQLFAALYGPTNGRFRCWRSAPFVPSSASYRRPCWRYRYITIQYSKWDCR